MEEKTPLTNYLKDNLKTRTPFTDYLKAHLEKKTGLVGVEVGVRDGTNAIYLLNSLDIKKLYLVDSFLPYNDCGVRDYTADDQEKEYEKLILNIDEFFHKTIIIRQTSKRARETLLRKSGIFDFVYIDADHKYESVKDDLKWWDFLKIGGVLGGHDYGSPFAASVQLAVDEFINEKKSPESNVALGTSRGGVEWGIVKLET